MESNLRKNYATLTQGETITIQHTTHNATTGQTEARELSFLVAELTPSADGVLIINTDLEVDIVPLDSKQAENAVKAKHDMNGNLHNSYLQWVTNSDSTARAQIISSVPQNATSYYQIAPLPNHPYYYVEIEKLVNDVDVYISFQHSRPNEVDHDYYYVGSNSGKVHVTSENMDPTHPRIYFAVRNVSAAESKYQLIIVSTNEPPVPNQRQDVWAVPVEKSAPGPDYIQCDNCHQWIPKQTLPTHEAFCIRNNTNCPRCDKVFKKSDFNNHWHCDDCDYSGPADTREKHINRIHTSLICTCGKALYLPEMAQHRAESCPDRYIICRYCHIRQKAGPRCTSPKDWMLGLQLSEHESECGARTIECVTCKKPVQLKV